MENMKEVLKKTRKAKHKKPRVRKDDETTNAISEFLSKSWKFSSPPANKVESPAKVNAFERLMARKQEPLVAISPESNGTKKKRKYNKSRKSNKAENESEEPEDFPIEENSEVKIKVSGLNGMKRFVNASTNKSDNDASVEEMTDSANRKRGRAGDIPSEQVDGILKKRKTKEKKMLLDSNENTITPTYRSERPRRSCAGMVDYECLLSPENGEQLPSTTPKRGGRPKKKIENEDFEETLVVVDTPKKDANPTKLAPLFFKKLPKPSVNPAVKEARRNFLLSGLPEELRNSIDKQKQYEEDILGNELIAFPLISHVTQLKNEQNVQQEELANEGNLWTKSIIKIKAEKKEDKDQNRERLLKCGELTNCNVGDTPMVISYEIRSIERESIDKSILKRIVKENKEAFGNYPTNRCFNQLHTKFSSSKAQDVDDAKDVESEEGGNDENMLFIDIFKPSKFVEFFINCKPVKELQTFLLTWNEKTEGYDSDESNSRTSTKGMNNFAVLSGSSGSGKTSSVYALANELNYQVIEINAGSRRSGKKMLENLLEATQSHRVKDKSGKLFSTCEEDAEGSPETNCESSPGAKSIILIEDAELAFESDDGFISAVQQLINISKRPVILTTNNRKCQHLQKFIQQHEVLYDVPMNEANKISKYLSLMCLAANYQISVVSIEQLFALNGHDLRKTINEIEFFIRSENTRSLNGGDLMKFYVQPRHKRLAKSRLKYSVNCVSTLCFESSIASNFAALFDDRADNGDISYHQHHLTDEIAEFLSERSNVAEPQRDLALGKQKVIER